MVDYIDTRIGFVRDKSQDEYIYAQARVELERLERARRKRRKSARNSFVEWMSGLMAQMGRTFGYHILIPRIKIVRLYKWLFDY